MAKRNRCGDNQGDEQLKSRLRDYAIEIPARALARVQPSQLANWGIYAAATGSALAMATGASASIISFQYGSNTVTVPSALTTKATAHINADFFDIGCTGLAGFAFPYNGCKRIDIEAATFRDQLAIHSATSQVRIFGTGSYAKRFITNSVIGAGVGDLKVLGVVQGRYPGSSANFGNFTTGPGFAGFAIALGGGNFDYGWLKLVFTNAPDGTPYSLTGVSYGIETTPNQSIQAGQTVDASSSPEPGTMGLGLLAAGAAGVTALRKRKRQS